MQIVVTEKSNLKGYLIWYIYTNTYLNEFFVFSSKINHTI